MGMFDDAFSAWSGGIDPGAPPGTYNTAPLVGPITWPGGGTNPRSFQQWLQSSGLTGGSESDPYNLGDFAQGSPIGNSNLYRQGDESQEDFLRRVYTASQGANGEWGIAGRNFNTMQNAGFFNELQPFDYNGQQYARVGEDVSQIDLSRLGPKQRAVWERLGVSNLGVKDPTYGYAIPLSVQRELAKAASMDNQGDWIDQGGLGKALAAIATGGIASGAIFGGAALAGGAGGVGGASLADSLGSAGFMDFANPGAFMNFAGTTPGLSLSPLATASGFSLAPGAGLTFEGMPIDQAWGVNPRLTDFMSNYQNPFEPGDNPLSQLDFSQPSNGFAQNTPGLSLNSLSTPGGLSLAPGAGLTSGGSSFGSGILDFLRSPSNPFGIRDLVSAGGNLANSLLMSRAAQRASGQQVDSAREANALLAGIYDQNRKDLEPWRTAGTDALGRVKDLLTPGKQLDTAMLDPGYAFRQSEGEKGVNRAAAARGRYDSPRTIKDLLRFNQDYATGEFGNVFNRNAGVANMGQAAAAGTVAAGQNYGTQAAQNITGAGNASAAGTVGSANAFSGGINNFLSQFTSSAMLRDLLNSRNSSYSYG